MMRYDTDTVIRLLSIATLAGLLFSSGLRLTWGAIAGGLIIGIAEVLSVGYVGANFVDISVFGLLLLILFIRPTGLFAGLPAGRSGI
jgi:branched-chain amino acid transport system permease protein